MDRWLKPLFSILVTGLALATLASCPNAALVIDDGSVSYLGIADVTPDDLDPVSPWVHVVIVFDQAIDLGTLSSSTVLLEDEAGADVGWTYSYDEATSTLTILPDALDGDSTYTVTVTVSLKGTGGDALQSPYTFSFTTRPGPSGTMTINDANGYVNATSVSVSIAANLQAVRFRLCAADAGGHPTFTDTWDEVATPDFSLDEYPATLLGAQGVNTIFIQFADLEDTTSPETAIADTIVFDSEKPVVSTGTLAWLNAANPARTANATASDATSGIDSIAWTGDGLAFSDPAALTPSISAAADGSYTATVTVTDRAGNSDSQTLPVNRDVTPPAVDIGTLPWINVANASRTTASTATDANSFVCLWTGPAGLTFTPVDDPVTTITASANGSYTATLTVTDDAGNATSADLAVNRDRTAPVVTSLGAVPAWLNAAGFYAVPILSDAGGSGIAAYLWSKTGGTASSVTFSAPTSMKTDVTTSSADGTTVVIGLTVTDGAGNTGSLSSSTMTVDRTGPVVSTFTINDNDAYTNLTGATLTIDASDARSGIDQVRYSNNGSSWSSWGAYALEKAWTLTSTNGTRTVYYEIRDVAGNVTQKTDSIILDTVAPTVTAVLINGYVPSTDSTSVNLGFGPSDETSGVRYYATRNDSLSWSNWIEFVPGAHPHTLQDSRGTRRVTVKVQDWAGNESLTAYDEIILNARISVTYTSMYITDDGDVDPPQAPQPGEIYYQFFIDDVLTLYREESDSLELLAPSSIPPWTLPESTYTIHENPTTGRFTLTGTLYDDDGASYDTGVMSIGVRNAPFPAKGTVDTGMYSILGDIEGHITISIRYEN